MCSVTPKQACEKFLDYPLDKDAGVCYNLGVDARRMSNRKTSDVFGKAHGRRERPMRLQLTDLAESVQVGYQARGAVDADPDGTHWLIHMRDLREDGAIEPEGLRRFTPDRATEPYTVDDGDVLLQVRGMRHNAGVVRDLPENTLASNHFYILRIDRKRALPEYVAWYINQPSAQSHLLRGAQGAGNVTVVTRPVFEALEVPLPPLETQAQLVAVARLQRREKELTERILSKRAAWLSAVSLQLAEGNGISTRNEAT